MPTFRLLLMGYILVVGWISLEMTRKANGVALCLRNFILYLHSHYMFG